ncbi:titin isoform X1 [Condylostylus longicornis]|uniref:titin isoform X1 n=1 Tax=Condylostylus longicornis TaxID=2530218 RepID=UPI00244E14A0|nr:titin isoform X1 [Condylostylus longicornis]
MNSLNEDNLQQTKQQLTQGTKHRSASVGALPREKKHFTSRNESASGISLDVRCACQYFQCDSLLPERVNPVGSRPESKIGFASNIPGGYYSESPNQQPLYQAFDTDGTTGMHGRHPDIERMSLRSLGGQKSFDRASNKSFELTQDPIDPGELAKQGLVVCNIVEPTYDEEYSLPYDGVKRGISIDRLSQKSFGQRQDFDTISHRSFSGVRKIESRSGSKQDLYVADICIPTTQVSLHSRRSSKTELPYFNIISATPTPSIGGNKPEFSVYEEFRKNKAGLEEKENIPSNINQRQSGIIKQTSLPTRFDQMGTSMNVPDIEPVYQPTTIPKTEPNQIEIQTISIDISTNIVEVREDPTVLDADKVVEEGIKAESRPSSPLHSPKLLHKRETGIHPGLSEEGSPRSMSPPSLPTSGYFGTSPSHSPIMNSRNEDHMINHDQPRFLPPENLSQSDFNTEPTDQTVLHATLSIPSGRMSPQSTTYKISGTATSLGAVNHSNFETNFPNSKHGDLNSTQRPSSLAFSQQTSTLLSSNQISDDNLSNIPVKEKTSFSFFGRKRSKDNLSPERPVRKKKEKITVETSPTKERSPIREKSPFRLLGANSNANKEPSPMRERSPIKEKSPIREKSPFRLFGKDTKKAKEATPIREKSPVREKSPFRLFGTESKSEPVKQERSSSIFLSAFGRNGKEKSPSRERSPSLSPLSGRRKSSVKPGLVMISAGENDQVMSIGGPQKIALTDSSKLTPAIASSVQETFTLKVDELDQYAPKPKANVTSSIPSRYSSQQLKVSTINLNEPTQVQPLEPKQQKSSSLANRPLSITSSQPNISSLSKVKHDESTSREPSIAPSFAAPIQAVQNTPASIFTPVQIAPNLVSVAIGIPHQSSQSEEFDDLHASDALYFEEGDTKVQSSNANINQVISQQRFSSETRQLPSRTPSEQRLRQSSLLRRKNYFDRTQSQDRAHSSQDSGNESMIGRMSKTVSFDFVEQRSSRLDEHEKSKTKATKRDWLERSYFMRDHEYEPIGEPQDGAKSQNASTSKKESTPQPSVPSVQISQPMEVEQQIKESAEAAMELLQKDLEDRYLSSATTTPRSESRTDTEIRTSQVDTSALEELPLKPENRRKGLLASAQDRSRRFKAGIRNQAGKVKTKVRGIKKPTFRKPTLIKKETVSKTEIGDVLVVSEVVTETKVDDDASALSEPKNKKRFKAPDFSNIKMPDMPKFKSPDMSKLKAKAGDLKKIEFKKPEFKKPDFKRPEFTKVDMSKFKIPEKFSSLKLKRSRSFKEGDTSVQTGESGTTPESAAALQEKEPAGKKKFDFTFGTYPRALRRKKIRDSIENIVKPTDLSTQPSTETPPSVESSQPTVQRGTRDKGPVGSRWADKFSDVSYGGDSESGRFQRYGSEIESFERESSVERRMKDDLIAQEEAELALISDPSRKQFVEFDEENREIHKISRDREAEFKHRRPMIHQDSNLSEESRDVGWSDKDVLRNKMLQRAEMESESYSNNYPSEEGLANHETQSTGSSTKKGVIEEIDDDEFFLRKRGISQDNIEIRQYISSAIREGFDNPINTLQQLGSSQGEYPDSMIGISSDNVDFGYNIPRTPPRKPKRQKQQYNNLAKNVDDSQEISQEFDIEQKENYGDNISLPQTGSDFFKNIPPNRPLRRSKKGFQQDSQSDIPYFEEIDKDFYQHKEINLEDPNMMVSHKYDDEEELQFQDMSAKPIAPKRRKKRTPQSEERDLIMNGFGGRSVSNTYLEENIPHQDMIVYRTEHEYVIPLAKPESYEGTPDMNERRSTSRTNNEEDDRTSRGAESFIDEALVIMESGDNEQKFRIEMEDSHGYAVVRKEPPPRPPPPSRQKKSPSRFSTMPLPKKSPPPERPKRNYSTIAPDRPPRRPSLEHSEEPRIIPDATQYEELDIEENLQRRADSPLKLKSGEIINKMKYRPLPPPPRPPREKRDKSKHKLERDDFDDHDGEGERIATEAAFEVEISTQTDPLPDDFVFEEFEITDDMKIIEPRNSKTLEDILKEDDKEMEGVKWNGDDNLTRGIQRFRESTQRSFSEKSRASSAADRSKSHSRPQTPAAIVVEKRVPTPIPNSRTNETMLEASLTVQPIDDHDFDIEENITKTSLQGDGSFNESVSYQASTVKSVGEHSGESYEEERLMDFAAEEQLVREEEEREKLREEMRKIQKEKEEEEERLIMEKIRELQRMEEEEERKTIEKLKELEILEQQEKRRLQKEAEEEERRQREEQDRRILEKIKELERQEEEDRRIMEKLRQLEKEFSAAEEAEKQEANLLETEKQETVKEGQDFIEEQEIVKQTFEAPSRPPRKRPSVPNIAEEDQIKSVALETTALAPVSEKPIVDISTVPSQTSLPSHMALADLEVERLRVHALQAGHIMVSNLQGSQISADELECKGGNLVVRNLELPPGFIEDIVERVRSTERTHVQVETQTVENDETQKSKPVPSEKTESRGVPTHHQTQHMYEQRPFIAEDIPPRPPLPPLFPSEYMHSIPPAAFYQLRNPDDEEYQPNLQAPRRRRHYRRRDSSSDDDHHRRRSRSRRSPEPTVAQLGGQFLQACGTSLLRRLSQVANAMQFSVKEGGERNIGILIAMFILMTLGFLLMAMSGKNIHHHHWDFFNPPNNEGRRQ